METWRRVFDIVYGEPDVVDNGDGTETVTYRMKPADQIIVPEIDPAVLAGWITEMQEEAPPISFRWER